MTAGAAMTLKMAKALLALVILAYNALPVMAATGDGETPRLISPADATMFLAEPLPDNLDAPPDGGTHIASFTDTPDSIRIPTAGAAIRTVADIHLLHDARRSPIAARAPPV